MQRIKPLLWLLYRQKAGLGNVEKSMSVWFVFVLPLETSEPPFAAL